jgi:hypothetical protein
VAFNPLIVTFPFFVKLMPSCHLLWQFKLHLHLQFSQSLWAV